MHPYFRNKPKTKQAVKEHLFKISNMVSRFNTCANCNSNMGMESMFLGSELDRDDIPCEYSVVGPCKCCGEMRVLMFPNIYTNAEELEIANGVILHATN